MLNNLSIMAWRHGEWRQSSTFLGHGTGWGWVVSFKPLPLYPRRKSQWYPLNRRLGGLQSRYRSREDEIDLVPAESKTPTLQPVAGHQNNWPIAALIYFKENRNENRHRVDLVEHTDLPSLCFNKRFFLPFQHTGLFFRKFGHMALFFSFNTRGLSSVWKRWLFFRKIEHAWPFFRLNSWGFPSVSLITWYFSSVWTQNLSSVWTRDFLP